MNRAELEKLAETYFEKEAVTEDRKDLNDFKRELWKGIFTAGFLAGRDAAAEVADSLSFSMQEYSGDVAKEIKKLGEE